MDDCLSWPVAAELRTSRLVLEPLHVDHATAMVAVLSDPSLYDVVGGRPPTRDEFVATYSRQVVGHASDGSEGWLNWVVVEASTQQAVGYVQATMTRTAGNELRADVAWVVGAAWQGRGLAFEAARGMLEFLGDIEVVSAFIQPGHRASERVAERLGMRPTAGLVDGETRWELRVDGN